jgi:hypothetical protein
LDPAGHGNASLRGLIGIQEGWMQQQSQRRPRVRDLQPWQTEAPLDKPADLPLGWSAVRIDFEGMRKKTEKEKEPLDRN